MSKNSKSTSAVTADPTTLSRERQMWNTAQGLAAQPFQAYGGEQVAGFTGDQQAGFDAVRGAAGAGTGAVNAGLGLAGQAGAFNPSMVTAPTLDPAAQANGAGLDAMYAAYARTGPQAGARDAASLDAAAKMGQYQNPYEDQVVQSALADQEIQRQRAIMQGQAQATAGGAYGGSRHGVMDSLTNEAAIRAAGATAGNLRSQGFQFAGQMGAADANRDLQAQQGNQQADVATSSTNAGLSANLFGCDLRNADLRQANLRRADLRGCCLRGANMSQADLTQADFREGQIAIPHPRKGLSVLTHEARSGDAEGANFSGASLERATGLTQARLSQACGDEATRLPRGLSIPRC